MKHSIRAKLFWGVFTLILFSVVLSSLLNMNYLSRYYIAQKKHDLIREFKLVDRFYQGEPEQHVMQLERLTRTKGVNMILLNQNYEIKYDSFPRPLGFPFFASPQDPRINMIIKLLQQNPRYHYHTAITREPLLNMRYLSLAGRLHHGGYLWIGTPLAEIEGSVAIANQFSVFTGIIAVFLGGLWVFFYARRFTQPILELNRMAQDMTKLDFKRKYKGKNRDEIDDLGHNINSLSEQLDHSITELREANLQLEVENEYRRKVDEMRKEFISNISHELKTPLALVQGYAEGLELDIAGDQADKDYYCHVILDETKKMDRLVRTLLDLSEIDSGYYQLDLERVDLAEIISHVVEKYKLMLEEKGVKLDCQADENLLIWADPVRIEQVLNNFINNALQHMNEAKRLRIRAISEAGKVRLTVFNSGDAIPEEALEQIWSSFYKVDKARTRAYGGTGLGLAIVRAIVKLHQGNYGVKNLSDGVEFWVEFDSEIGSGA